MCDETAKVFPVCDSDVLGAEMSDKANLPITQMPPPIWRNVRNTMQPMIVLIISRPSGLYGHGGCEATHQKQDVISSTIEI